MTFLVRRLCIVVFLGVLLVSDQACAQLRIVTYNTANGSFSGNQTTPRAGMDTVLQAIADESVNGIAKPIDALILQEQASPATTTQGFVNLLNGIYGAGTYARSVVTTGGSTIRQSLVYNTNTLQLLSEQAFGNTGSEIAPRQSIRFEMRPVGYGSDADFFIYNSHYKAGNPNSISSGSSTTNGERRLIEATDVRANADALGQGASIIYAGDFNVQSSTRPMYQELLSSGNGQAFDPISTPGNWNNNFSFRTTHTQNSTDGSSGLSTAGGLDDRFDFQLVTAELLDDEGLSYIPGSYRAFGNNGTAYNQAINSAGNTYPLTGTQLDALASVSDHLPVVADYQVPAILSAQLDSIPSNVPLGVNFSVDVLVENVANVVSALGADELDFNVTVSGDLFGGGAGTDSALGGPSAFPIMLDTSVEGLRGGLVTVTTSSQGAPSTLVSIPVSFTVGEVNTRPFLARDDFDSPIGLNSFVQSPMPEDFSSAGDGFQRYQVGVSQTIPFALVDQSSNGNPSDVLGVVNEATKLDGWFGITDLDNDDNPSGSGTATWEFDIAGATSLEVSIDMAAMGDFESSDTFDWSYSIDGGQAMSLFSSSVDEAGSALYTLADGDSIQLNDPLVMNNSLGVQTQLSNLFQTISSAISGTGDVLTVQLEAATDGGSEAFAFDNLIIEGVAIIADDADFDQDGDVDGQDFLTWQRGVGIGTSLSEGDANGDGQVDQLDLAAWQSQYAASSLGAGQVAANVPEPNSLLLLLGALGLFASRARAIGC